MARPTTRLPPIPEQLASEEPPTRFDQSVPDGWLEEEPTPASTPAAKAPPKRTVRLDVSIPGPLPPPLPTRPKAREMSPTTRVAIIAGCVGFMIGMAVTATMAMTIRPAPPPCTSALR
ncbi:MAG: hypothetical protein AB7K71_07135 [Polyangiaceae bacterium]